MNNNHTTTKTTQQPQQDNNYTTGGQHNNHTTTTDQPKQLLQDTGETGEERIESNDNPADSVVGKVKTSSGDDEQMHAVSTSNDDIKDGVSNTQNQQHLINSK